ncbi:MAG: hypothetical protein LUG44_11875 [Clostridiales bacterium]|nr:hypothetical protein [Clostridiales bacterium]
MNDEIIMEMLAHLEEAQNALKPRGDEFEDSMEKISVETRYWRRVIDNGEPIRFEAVKETVAELHNARERVQAYLDNTGWKDNRVCDAYIALVHAINTPNRVEKMPRRPALAAV